MTRCMLHGLGLVTIFSTSAAADWLAFRGSDGTGVSADENVPTSWSDAQNVAWVAKLPGRGVSSPIVVGDRVILTACSGPDQNRLHVLCFDAHDGHKRWERRFWATGRTMCHPKTCMAAPTPASDGKRIFALFATCDLICLDLEGNLQWLRGLGRDYPGIGNNVGLASSPVVWQDVVCVLLENDGDSFAAGIDARTGRNRWKIRRDNVVNWSTPTVLAGQSPSEDLLLLQTGTGLSAHDPVTGARRWTHEAKCTSIASPVVHQRAVVIPTADGATMLRAEADDGPPKRLWNARRLRSPTASPLIYRGRVYTVSGSGVLSCADLETGDQRWQLRLKGPFSASPIAADGRLYCFNEDGRAHVVGMGDPGKFVSTNEMGETILASPAIAHASLYVRSDSRLWRIARTP